MAVKRLMVEVMNDLLLRCSRKRATIIGNDDIYEVAWLTKGSL